MGVVINTTLNCGCGLLCSLEKWMQSQLNCSSISIGSTIKTPGADIKRMHVGFSSKGGFHGTALDPPLCALGNPHMQIIVFNAILMQGVHRIHLFIPHTKQ